MCVLVSAMEAQARVGPSDLGFLTHRFASHNSHVSIHCGKGPDENRVSLKEQLATDFLAISRR